jgi:acyl transferase domain-containing protein
MVPVARPRDEPIAIVGIGCRFPGGAGSPAAFWNLLLEQTDAVREIPPERWDLEAYYHPAAEMPGKTCARAAGLLERIDAFDADFFGISPREASRISPQHRLLLELAWEALEDAGLVAARLAGSKTGVFVGISNDEYGDLQFKDLHSVNAYTCIGSALSIAANRTSYFFDFRGPSVAVDTACSSSLVATHLGCQSLWRGESDLALVGGVHLLLGPERFVGFSQAHMLAPNGRCRAFDAGASGYVRAEGGGMVVLKPLSRAVADRDPIYAVILATGTNQDGRTPGLSFPSDAAQEALLREVYERAGVALERVQYIEAHGTGTAVGDPAECAAMGRAVGASRPAGKYLHIGSVKTNLGHLEPASGVAGLVKLALALHHGLIPASLHFQTPNPRIDFEALRLRVQQTAGPWPAGQQGAVAGVSSFGFGGANVHAVLQHYHPPEAAQPAAEPDQCLLLPISARSAAALEAVARAYRAAVLDEPNLDLHDLCYSASVRRDHHEHRLAVVGRSAEELGDRLGSFLAGEQGRGIATGRVSGERRPRVAFVFSGNGPQWWGMARRLLREQPVFRQAVETCDRLLRQQSFSSLAPRGCRCSPWSLLEELQRDEANSRMTRTEVAQPALFSIQVGLVDLWRSWGVLPDAVVGHSVGEVAAAWAAGVLSLEDAVRVIFHRSRTQEATAGKGKMAAVELDVARAREALVPYGGRLVIAAINAPTSVTLSGDTDALLELIQALQTKQVYCRLLPLDYSFHSHHMDPVRDDLLASLTSLRPQRASLPFFSVVTGAQVEGPECGPQYWWDNIRKPVLFDQATDRLLEDGCKAFLEIGPHPVLASYLTESSSKRGVASRILPSLRRNEDDLATLLQSLGGLYAIGYPVEWDRLFPQGGRFVRLPAYPWQRERHWHQPEANGLVGGKQVHPLVGQRLESAQPHWQGRVDTRLLPYLHDHKIQGATVFPGTGFLEMSWVAGSEVLGDRCQVEEGEILEALTLEVGRAPLVQVVISPDGAISALSRSLGGEGDWQLHFRGRIVRDPAPEKGRRWSLSEVLARCPREIPRKEVYRQAERRGYHYGPAFQGLERIWVGQGEAVGEVRVCEALRDELAAYEMHPAILDACCQTIIPLLPSVREESTRTTWVPVAMQRYRVLRRPGDHVLSYVRLIKVGADWLSAEFSVQDPSGTLVSELRGVRLQAVSQVGRGKVESSDGWLYQPRWQLQPLPGALPAQRHSVFLEGPRELAASLQPFVQQWACDLGADHYYQEVEPAIHPLCTAFLGRALEKLGWAFRPGERLTAADLVMRTGILRSHEPLIDRYLQGLTRDGVLQQDGEEYLVCHPPAAQEPEEMWRKLAIVHPAFHAELLLLGRLGRCLEQCLTGAADPAQILVSNRSGTLEHLFEAAPTSRLYNRLLREVVARAVQGTSSTDTIRILEVGAGTGGATGHVVPMLPAERTKYVFTDRSPDALAWAAEKFRSCSFLAYAALDLEQHPDQQGLSRHSFDLILAANILSETADVKQALGHLADLLAPRGLLVLLERTRPMPALEFTFGLLPGRNMGTWSPFPPQRWVELVESAGFDEVALLADQPACGPPMQSLLLGRGPQPAPEAVVAPPPPAMRASETWALFADATGLGQLLAERLRAAAARVVLVEHGDGFHRQGSDAYTINPAEPEDTDNLVRVLQGESAALTGIVHCWSLEAAQVENTTAASLQADQDLGCLSVLHLVQALGKSSWVTSPRLWLVTRSAQAAGSEPLSVAQAPLWGLGRVIRNEHPDLRCTLVDLGSTVPGFVSDVRPLEEELSADDGEEEVLLRDSGRYVSRLVRATLPPPSSSQQRNASPHRSFRLRTPAPGSLGNLSLEAVDRKAPGVGEVEIEVVAAGMNFKDVLQATGMLTGEALAHGYVGGLSLGLECAGRVVTVGADVREWRVGDEVVGFARDAFAGHVITKAAFIARKPAHLSFEEAATIPITFCTACYALRHLGRLRRGEQVLIHGAAGGVGLAALEVARHLGAEVFATAGSPEKREFLRLLGVAHVMDSRSVAFADEVLETTGGEGVDLVLNSLSGEAIPKSLGVLRPFGRFLEIGKRDLVQNTRVGLRPFEKCLSFHAIDLDQLLLHQPAAGSALLREVFAEFEARVFHPLPHRVFSLGQVEHALEHLQRSRHIGKVVLSMPGAEAISGPRPHQPAREPVRFHAEASYLISGGLSGLGLATARWMVEKGARHLVLLGRSGASTPEAVAAVEAMKAAGAVVLVRQVDISEEQQVEALLQEVQQSLPPLRGVIHSAMVMDDGILLHLNAARFHRVLAPKAAGAWNLHQHTRHLHLDFFVCFSSFTSLLGLGGQGSYAAANLFLDVLAPYRRSCGLPGLTINWGPLGDVGWLARHSAVNERVLRQGVRSLSAQQALDVLGRLLASAATQVGVIDADWREWARLSFSGAGSPRLATLLEAADTEHPAQSSADFASALSAAAPGTRREMVLSHLCARLAGVLGTSPAKLDVHRPITALGLDSLMAVELQARIQRDMGVHLSVMSLLQRQTLADLAGFLEGQLGANGSTATAGTPAAGP